MAGVQLAGISKRFGDVAVLKDIDIDIADGEFMVFVGPSGCGKSTLLRTISGLEKASGGHIRIGDRDVTRTPPAKRGVAMVFQSYALYPHMTVFENIAFGLRLAKLPKDEVTKRVDDVARVLQIEDQLERKPWSLSGGQRQRVAIGRAIVRDPDVFLFDEPLSNLDAALRVQMRLELIRLHRRLQATMVYVTHDQIEAMTMADRIVVLNDGVVEQIGGPLELYHRPRNRFVAGFIGSPKMNFLDAEVVSADNDQATVSFAGSHQLAVPVVQPPAAQTVTLGVRPEHLLEPGSQRDADIALPGEVLVVEHLGGETLIHVGLEDGTTVQLRGVGDSQVAVGENVSVGMVARHCHIFDASGTAVTTGSPMADPVPEQSSAASVTHS
jgi:multiple sugar transport system ATP-binding protein